MEKLINSWGGRCKCDLCFVYVCFAYISVSVPLVCLILTEATSHRSPGYGITEICDKLYGF